MRYIGRIAVPEQVPTATFPLRPEYGSGRAIEPQVFVHQFGTRSTKTEQRFLAAPGVTRFRVVATLNPQRRAALRQFWEEIKGAFGLFYYDAPVGHQTERFVCRFADPALTLEYLTDAIATAGVDLIEVPQTVPQYPLNSVQTRFPSQALQEALLGQVQILIPLLKIRVREQEVPDIYLADRDAEIGGQLYQARILEWDGISQELGGAADQARFVLGNADRVLTELANDTLLDRATVEFSLYHVGTGIRLDLWRGFITDWSCGESPAFEVVASDGLYELNLPYPRRVVSRTCWKTFRDGVNCPASGQNDDTPCDKGFDTPRGCVFHGRADHFGGIVAKPQGVRIRDTQQKISITSTSIVADSIYGQAIPEIYTDIPMPVKCLIAAGREESDFYDALGIVGEGPITFDSDPTKHKLDGQPPHGPGSLGLRTSRGFDPNPDPFGLTSTSGPDPAERAAGTAFIEIRRSDPKGIQLSRITEHEMEATVSQGMGGWWWSDAETRHWSDSNTNPVWVAVNMLLRACGAWQAPASEQLSFFDVEAAIAAAAVCETLVEKLIGEGQEAQFKFRGVLAEQKPLRDWLQEVLNNCLGYFTFSFGRLKIGLRINSSAVEAFTAGNVVLGSLRLTAARPQFNHLTARFADEEYGFQANAVSIYDLDHAALLGGSGPLFLQANMDLCGTTSKSQAARIITTRLREELGGITPAEWKAARQVAFKTTVLALNVEPGMVCSLTHPDMPGGYGEFRVTRWRLNRDFSIEIEGRTTTDSMYDLTVGPKPADVPAEPLPEEIPPAVPGLFLYTPARYEYGTFTIENCRVESGRVLGVIVNLVYIDDLTTDVWAETLEAIDGEEDPVTISVRVNPDRVTPPQMLDFKKGDWIIFNDPGAYECGQLTDIQPGDDDTLLFTIRRHYPGTEEGRATFESWMAPHAAGTKIFKLQVRTFPFSAREENWEAFEGGVPPRFDMQIPSVTVCAVVACAWNNAGYGTWVSYNCASATMPGIRTHTGLLLSFQFPGALVTGEDVAPRRVMVQRAAMRVAFATLEQAAGDAVELVLRILRSGQSEWRDLLVVTVGQGEAKSHPDEQPPHLQELPYGADWPAPVLYEGDAVNLSIRSQGTGLGSDLTLQLAC